MATSTDSTGKGLLLKAEAIADTFRDEIVQVLQSRPRPPKLVGILATSAPPSRFYAEFTKKQCLSFGFDFVLKEIGAALNPENGEGDGVEEAIMEANEDDTVDGIMVCPPPFFFCVFGECGLIGTCRFTTLSLVTSRYAIPSKSYQPMWDRLTPYVARRITTFNKSFHPSKTSRAFTSPSTTTYTTSSSVPLPQTLK